jgi:hypothetical protein
MVIVDERLRDQIVHDCSVPPSGMGTSGPDVGRRRVQPVR